MLKIEINLDPKIKETLVKIYACKMTQEVETLERMLTQTTVQRLAGYKDNQIIMLDQDKIMRFMIQEKKVFAITEDNEYTVRLRLYELEERLKSSSFIRISQGELVNLDYIHRLDLSFQGTIEIEFKNKTKSYVSRRSIKNFKKALGL